MTSSLGISESRKAERARRLAELGPRPSWWRFVARRRWRRSFSAIMAMDISTAGAIYAAIYTPESVDELTRRRNPWLPGRP